MGALDTAPAVRLERAANGAVVVARGALIYSLWIGENKTAAGTPFPAYPAGVDWNVTATLAWNRALVIPDLDNPASAFNFTVLGPPGDQPFAGGDAAPVAIVARARTVAWTEVRSAAAPPPASPVDCAAPGACGDAVPVTLLPHGCTLLRMTALPYTVA